MPGPAAILLDDLKTLQNIVVKKEEFRFVPANRRLLGKYGLLALCV
jgi:hypothetical protein